jgi:hypothetical protein
MRHILTGRIKPLQTLLAPDDGGGEGGAGNGEAANGEPKGLGGSFKAMLATMSGDGTPPEQNTQKEKQETPEAKAALGDQTKLDAAAAAAKEAAAAKAKEKPPKKGDPLLEILKEKKAEDPDKKVEPTEAEKVDAAKRAADIEAATKGLSPKAAENFKAVAAARDAAEQKANALQKELETLKAAKPAIPPEIQEKLARLQEIETEHASLLDVVQKIGAERSPAYQNKFVKGKNALVEKAANIVKKFGGNADDFKAALALNGRERSDALSESMADLHDMDRTRVAAILTEIESLDEEGGSFLENAKESLMREEQEAQQMERQRQTEMVQAREAAFHATANKMLHRLPDDHPLAAEANPMVDKALQEAKKFLFEGSDFNEFAEASVAKAMYPLLQQRLLTAAQTIAELEERLEELTNAEPGGGGSGGGSGTDAKGEEKGFADRFKGAMTVGAGV